jgi:MFS family permease
MKVSLQRIPKSIWALGFVSLFMDTSSELIHSLLPVFLVSTLRASVAYVGVVEGVAEASALIAKLFSGTLSDYFGKRKPLTLIGYGLAALSKPLFPLANTVGMVLAARFIDRIGKGIRGAPRDALIGDIAPPEIRGTCFGLRQALDTVGAFLGPLLAVLGMLVLANNLRAVLWIAVIPAIIAFLILAFSVKEPAIHHAGKIKTLLRIRDIRHVGSAYWQLVAIAGVLTLARFSQAFLVLKAQATGLPIAFVPLVMVVMNIFYAGAAYPAGILSDMVNRKTVLLIGLAFLIAADVVLGFTGNLWMLALGVGLWGLHMAFSEGLLATMVTDATPAELRGTAYGIFNLVSGVALLAASIIAGLLWDRFGSSMTFFTGAAFTAVTFMGLLIVRVNHGSRA